MEAIRTGLRQIMGNLLAARPQEEAVVLAWPLVCGREVSSRTRAIGFHEGSLTVEVPDAAWRAQLAELAPRYLTAFTELVGPAVRKVKFVQQSGLSQKKIGP
jgi:hypothetical protein